MTRQFLFVAIATVIITVSTLCHAEPRANGIGQPYHRRYRRLGLGPDTGWNNINNLAVAPGRRLRQQEQVPPAGYGPGWRRRRWRRRRRQRQNFRPQTQLGHGYQLTDASPTTSSGDFHAEKDVGNQSGELKDVPFPEAPPLEGDLSVEDFEGSLEEDPRSYRNSLGSDEYLRVPAKDRFYNRQNYQSYRKPSYRRRNRKRQRNLDFPSLGNEHFSYSQGSSFATTEKPKEKESRTLPAVPESLSGHLPDMNKQETMTEAPEKEERWIDTSFIHSQHGTFTNQVLTEFKPLKSWPRYTSQFTTLVDNNVDAEEPIPKVKEDHKSFPQQNYRYQEYDTPSYRTYESQEDPEKGYFEGFGFYHQSGYQTEQQQQQYEKQQQQYQQQQHQHQQKQGREYPEKEYSKRGSYRRDKSYRGGYQDNDRQQYRGKQLQQQQYRQQPNRYRSQREREREHSSGEKQNYQTEQQQQYLEQQYRARQQRYPEPQPKYPEPEEQYQAPSPYEQEPRQPAKKPYYQKQQEEVNDFPEPPPPVDRPYYPEAPRQYDQQERYRPNQREQLPESANPFYKQQQEQLKSFKHHYGGQFGNFADKKEQKLFPKLEGERKIDDTHEDVELVLRGGSGAGFVFPHSEYFDTKQ